MSGNDLQLQRDPLPLSLTGVRLIMHHLSTMKGALPPGHEAAKFENVVKCRQTITMEVIMFIGLVSVLLAVNVPTPASRSFAEVSFRPDNDGAAVARLVGLDPKVFAVGGVSSQEVAVLLNRMSQATTQHAQLESMRQQLDALAQQVGRLRSQVRADPTNVAFVSQLRQARLQMRSVSQTAVTAREAFVASATTGLASPIIQRVLISRTSRSNPVPPEFWCISRTGEQRRQLEADLVMERRAVRAGHLAPSAVSARLAEARADPGVVAARQAMSTELPAIRAQFAL